MNSRALNPKQELCPKPCYKHIVVYKLTSGNLIHETSWEEQGRKRKEEWHVILWRMKEGMDSDASFSLSFDLSFLFLLSFLLWFLPLFALKWFPSCSSDSFSLTVSLTWKYLFCLAFYSISHVVCHLRWTTWTNTSFISRLNEQHERRCRELRQHQFCWSRRWRSLSMWGSKRGWICSSWRGSFCGRTSLH